MATNIAAGLGVVVKGGAGSYASMPEAADGCAMVNLLSKFPIDMAHLPGKAERTLLGTQLARYRHHHAYNPALGELQATWYHSGGTRNNGQAQGRQVMVIDRSQNYARAGNAPNLMRYCPLLMVPPYSNTFRFTAFVASEVVKILRALPNPPPGGAGDYDPVAELRRAEWQVTRSSMAAVLLQVEELNR